MNVGLIALLLVLASCARWDSSETLPLDPVKCLDGGNNRGSGDSEENNPFVVPKFSNPEDQKEHEEMERLFPSGGEPGETIFS